MAKKNFKNPAEIFISGADREAPEQEEVKDEGQQAFTIPKGYILTKEPKTERMQILIRPSTKEAIKKAVEEQGYKSMNDLINQILDEYIERQG